MHRHSRARSHSNPSRVKVVHNVAKGPLVNVYVDGNKVLSNVEYKVQSDYLTLPAGKHSLSIEAGNKVLATANVNLQPRSDYTVIAHGDVNNLSSIALLALQDNNACPARGKAHVRFIHAAAGAPAVDIWAEKVGKIFQNVSYGETGKPDYLPVDAGNVEISVTPSGTLQRVLGPIPLNLEEGKVYTVIASGIVGDKSTPLTALAHEDNKCSVRLFHSPQRHHRETPHRMSMLPLWLNL